jgi:hypothetical protein
LFLGAAVDSRSEIDTTTSRGPSALSRSREGWRLEVAMTSTAWSAKRLVLEGSDDWFEAHVEVDGQGAITDCRLLGGEFTGDRHRGPAMYRSEHAFRSLFNPEPSELERRCTAADAASAIDVVGTSLPGMRHWFFTPPPFCFGASINPPADGADLPEGPWLTLGLAAQPGENTFSRFAFDPLEDGFSLRLDYEGQTTVDGHWRSPSVLFGFDAADPYDGISQYVARLEARGLVPPPIQRLRPEWWRRPIFCGWGAQSHLALVDGNTPQAYSTQEHYDRFLAHLSQRSLTPGTIIIDDRWQSSYGTGAVDTEKWPDLRGWIAARHSAGQHVLLWWKAWDPEGIEAGLTVRDALGNPITVDPAHPGYDSRLREIVRNLLGPEGLDADGFKIDFTARTPSGPSLKHSGAAWGVELLHQLLAIIYTEAKRTKPEALVITHTPNPYFRDVTDMIRLNDVNTKQPVLPQMWHRARVVQAACPDLLIDCDNWQMPDRATWRSYLGMQRQIGVPSLYYATHVDLSSESFEEGDYAALAEAWKIAEGT